MEKLFYLCNRKRDKRRLGQQRRREVEADEVKRLTYEGDLELVTTRDL